MCVGHLERVMSCVKETIHELDLNLLESRGTWYRRAPYIFNDVNTYASGCKNILFFFLDENSPFMWV